MTFHYIFHPFRDGNWGTATLYSNFILMHHGYRPFVLPLVERKQYMASPWHSDSGDSSPFSLPMANLLHKSFNLYFSSLRIQSWKTKEALNTKYTRAIDGKNNYEYRNDLDTRRHYLTFRMLFLTIQTNYDSSPIC